MLFIIGSHQFPKRKYFAGLDQNTIDTRSSKRQVYRLILLQMHFGVS